MSLTILPLLRIGKVWVSSTSFVWSVASWGSPKQKGNGSPCQGFQARNSVKVAAGFLVLSVWVEEASKAVPAGRLDTQNGEAKKRVPYSKWSSPKRVPQLLRMVEPFFPIQNGRAPKRLPYSKWPNPKRVPYSKWPSSVASQLFFSGFWGGLRPGPRTWTTKLRGTGSGRMWSGSFSPSAWKAEEADLMAGLFSIPRV